MYFDEKNMIFRVLDMPMVRSDAFLGAFGDHFWTALATLTAPLADGGALNLGV